MTEPPRRPVPVPDRPPDEVTISGWMPTGEVEHVPAKSVATRTTGLFVQTVTEYTHLPAYDTPVFDRKVIEKWHTPEGLLARGRWLSRLTEYEKQELQRWYYEHQTVSG